jgi:PAS domain-containing protein
MAPYISPYASPLLTHARFLRSQYTDTANVVFIGPCIAKKHEADLYNEEIDAALTFAELREWLEKERITPRNAAAFAATASAANPAASGADYAYCSFEPRRGARGTGFPMEGGEVIAFSSYIKEAAAKEGTEVHTISISGIGSIQETLSGFDPATLTAPLFLELLACSGGCVNGPGMTDATSGLIRQMRLQEYARTADKALDSALLLQTPPLAADYPVVPFEAPAHTEQEIASALSLVGKYSFADRLNCSSCGYDTCRDFAVALLDGRAEKSMCASYMRKLANKTANTLIKAIPSGVVIVDRNLKIIDCNEQFARLLGPEVEELYVFMPGLEGADIKKISPFPQYFQAAIDAQDPELSQVDVRDGNKIYHLTVFAVEKGVTVAGVVEDITTPRVRIETTVERAQELIRKNVSTVQQIAFLLGENAAESESILNSIIESYTAETEDV